MSITLPDVLTSGSNPYVVQDTDVRGGYRTVATIAVRDAIPPPTRKEGMCVFVVAERKTYRYEQNAWRELPDTEAMQEALKNKLNYNGAIEVCRSTSLRDADQPFGRVVAIRTGLEATEGNMPILEILNSGGELSYNKFYKIQLGFYWYQGAIYLPHCRCVGTDIAPAVNVAVEDGKYVVYLEFPHVEYITRTLVSHLETGSFAPPIEQLISGWSIDYPETVPEGGVQVPVERTLMAHEVGNAARRNVVEGDGIQLDGPDNPLMQRGAYGLGGWHAHDITDGPDRSNRTGTYMVHNSSNGLGMYPLFLEVSASEDYYGFQFGGPMQDPNGFVARKRMRDGDDWYWTDTVSFYNTGNFDPAAYTQFIGVSADVTLLDNAWGCLYGINIQGTDRVVTLPNAEGAKGKRLKIFLNMRSPAYKCSLILQGAGIIRNQGTSLPEGFDLRMGMIVELTADDNGDFYITQQNYLTLNDYIPYTTPFRDATGKIKANAVVRHGNNGNNAVALQNALTTIQQLMPTTYQDTYGNTCKGLTTESLTAAVPELVYDTNQVDLLSLIPILVGAIKELSAQIQS